MGVEDVHAVARTARATAAAATSRQRTTRRMATSVAILILSSPPLQQPRGSHVLRRTPRMRSVSARRSRSRLTPRLEVGRTRSTGGAEAPAGRGGARGRTGKASTSRRWATRTEGERVTPPPARAPKWGENRVQAQPNGLMSSISIRRCHPHCKGGSWDRAKELVATSGVMDRWNPSASRMPTVS